MTLALMQHIAELDSKMLKLAKPILVLKHLPRQQNLWVVLGSGRLLS